ncbi:PXMP2/4 family protein 2 [Chlorella vulgaris]
MQAAVRATCRVGALSRTVCQAGRRGVGGPLPPAAPATRAVRSLAQQAGPCSSGAAGRSSGLAGMLRCLREQRVSFRTFSSGGGGGIGGGGSGGGSGGGGGGGGGSGGIFGSLWAAYLGLLERKPLATKALTAALLNGLGDAIAQKKFEKTETFDWKRFGIFTFLGLVLIGPALHYWYGSLGSLVKVGGNTGAALRMVVDQLCFAPLFISAIVSSIMTLEGKGPEVPGRLRRDLLDIMKSNWLLWVPFQFVNFRFVPPQLQVLMANGVALIWNVYMSWKSHT